MNKFVILIFLRIELKLFFKIIINCYKIFDNRMLDICLL